MEHLNAGLHDHFPSNNLNETRADDVAEQEENRVHKLGVQNNYNNINQLLEREREAHGDNCCSKQAIFTLHYNCTCMYASNNNI